MALELPYLALVEGTVSILFSHFPVFGSPLLTPFKMHLRTSFCFSSKSLFTNSALIFLKIAHNEETLKIPIEYPEFVALSLLRRILTTLQNRKMF